VSALLDELRALADLYSERDHAFRRRACWDNKDPAVSDGHAIRADESSDFCDRLRALIARHEQPDRTDESAARERLGRWLKVDLLNHDWKGNGNDWDGYRVQLYVHKTTVARGTGASLYEAIHAALDKAEGKD
jgi:hypothetical protein